MLSPTIGATLAEPIADIYRDAELLILERIAWNLSQGITAGDWELNQLQRLQRIRTEVLELLNAVNPAAADLIRLALAEAYGMGGMSAFEDVGKAVVHEAATPDQRALAVVGLARETAGSIATAQRSVLRAVDDVYARVIGDAVSQVATGVIGRETAVQRALDAFLGKGLTFVDTRRGRLNIADYAQMAVRTAAARTGLQGQIDTQRVMGLELTTIHPGPRACDICDKWARAVLTTGTQTGVIQMRNLGGDGWVAVKIDATLDEARAAGWGHPNCRCALRTFMPGITRLDVIERPPWDQEAYEAQQRQRAIERQIRNWKTRGAIAVTDAAKTETRERVKAWQGAMREHLGRHPDLKRQSDREQIGDRRGL